MKRKKTIAAMAAFTALAALGMAAAAWLTPLPERMSLPGSRVMEYADGSPMCVFLTPDEKWRIPVRVDEVDGKYIEALIKYEDKRFFHHPGVDPLAVVRAAIQNLRAGRVVSGASTITMQVVRILDPRPRTLWSKIIEALRAVQLELYLSKEEILGLYLQFVPYGGNLEGLEAASLSYFGHRATHLSPFEISYLLSVPQNPTDRYPSPENHNNMAGVIELVSTRLYRAGVFSRGDAEHAMAGIVPEGLRPFPRESMHAAQYLVSRNKGTRIRSTIRRDAQHLVESTLSSYRAEYERMGIHNAAAVVIEVESGKVIAAAGNFDFWDEEHQGQVIGFDASRSPGSAMKPFIYALAIDRGLALPGYLIADIPVRFSDYEPINYDHRYRGLIRLEDALSVSLNIPFINLTREIGLPLYLDFLRNTGINTLVGEPGYYGLSIAVGGLDVRLTELANLYAVLARDGEYLGLSWTALDRPRPARRVFSPGTAYLVKRSLRIKDRPDFPGRRRSTELAPEVFWKTGTSAFHRDAWALGGHNGNIAGVWVGNFDGQSSSYLVGSARAGPILFDILEGLPEKDIEDEPPDDLIKVKACAWSGYLANPNCPHITTALALRTNVPREHCPYHVKYLVDEETGFRLGPMCREGRPVREGVYTVLPASVRRWVSERELDMPAPPPPSPSCRYSREDGNPRIISPGSGSVFFMVAGLKADRQEIPLEADAGPHMGELFWFVDGRLLQSSAPDERVWLCPEPGLHKVSVVDSAGRSDTVEIRILPPG